MIPRFFKLVNIYVRDTLYISYTITLFRSLMFLIKATHSWCFGPEIFIDAETQGRSVPAAGMYDRKISITLCRSSFVQTWCTTAVLFRNGLFYCFFFLVFLQKKTYSTYYLRFFVLCVIYSK